MSRQHFRAGIDASDKMVAFDYHFITFSSNGETVSGAGFSPRHSAYCWAYQSFFDEVAFAAGRDQLEFRMDLLSRSFGEPPLDLERTRNTLKLAAGFAI